jgi:hypothetical protein
VRSTAKVIEMDYYDHDDCYDDYDDYYDHYDNYDDDDAYEYAYQMSLVDRMIWKIRRLYLRVREILGIDDCSDIPF